MIRGAADLTPSVGAQPVPYGPALYLAVVQFFFATTWTVYVIFLPALLEAIGIGRGAAIWILLLDQLIFTVTDTATGIAADRVGALVGRLGPAIVKATAISCVAFLALPQVVAVGAEGSFLTQATLLVLILVWTATSSCLRAPPWVMLSRYAAVPSVPWLAALSLLGLAVGSAVAPYVGTLLRNADPRLPFAISGATLFATTWGLIWVERSLAPNAPLTDGFRHDAPTQPTISALDAGLPSVSPRAATFLLAMAVLALGFQVHIQFNSSALYLKFASANQLESLLPVFWVGYSLLSLPAASLAARMGSVPVMAGCALLGTLGTALTVGAPNLPVMVVGQLLAGGAWGSMFMAGVSAALGYGRIGREGFTLGLWFSVQAVAAFIRIAAVATQLDKAPGFSDVALGVPPLLWLVGALVLLALARNARTGPEAIR